MCLGALSCAQGLIIMPTPVPGGKFLSERANSCAYRGPILVPRGPILVPRGPFLVSRGSILVPGG